MISSELKANLRRYFDSLPDQIILLDAGGKVACLNGMAEAYLGIGHDELEGKPLDRRFVEEKYGSGMDRLWLAIEAASGGKAESFEALRGHDERDMAGFDVTVRPLRGEGGVDSGIVIHMHDITLRCRNRMAMAKQNNNLAEMVRINSTTIEVMTAINIGQTLDQIFEIIFAELKKVIPYDRIGLSFLDEKGEQLTVVKVKSANPVQLTKGYACRIGVTSLAQVLDKSLRVHNEVCLLEGGKKRIIFDLERYVKDSGRMTPYNERLLREGIRTSLAVPLYVGLKPTGFIFFSSNIPKVYTREYLGDAYDTCMHLIDSVQPHLALALEKGLTITRLQETNQRLKELVSMKDDFLSIASHDLRSPLTTIIGFGKVVLEKTKVDETQRRALDIMTNSAGHLLILVDDMLSLAKADSGKMELNIETVCIGEILAQSLQAMSFNAHNKNVTLEHHKADCADLALDRSKMFQVFNNLIGNAIKFTPEGTAVVLRETVAGGMYRFAVTDKGPGITAEDQTKLFGKFVQVGTDAAAKQKGSGLGLMICKMIVEMHGGAIGVESAEGKGATFHFTVPIKKADG